MTVYQNNEGGKRSFIYPKPKNDVKEYDLCSRLENCTERESCFMAHSELEKYIWMDSNILNCLMKNETKIEKANTLKNIPNLPSNCPFELTWACRNCWRLYGGRVSTKGKGWCMPSKKTYSTHKWDDESKICLKNKEFCIREIPEKYG